MVGYPESLTDPSFKGQILVFTYPLIGNYGVFSKEERDENGLPLFFESDKIQVSGVIVGQYQDNFSHWRAVQSLSNWLKEEGVPALYDVDTRALTQKIRSEGSMLAQLRLEKDPASSQLQWYNPNTVNLVEQGILPPFPLIVALMNSLSWSSLDQVSENLPTNALERKENSQSSP